MLRYTLKIVILVVFMNLTVPAIEVLADYEDIGIGARPVAMGSAFAGLADDANSIYYNPAGLGLLKAREITGGESWLFLGLTDSSKLFNGFLGYVHPVSGSAGTFGLGWLSRSLRDNSALLGGREESFTRYAENVFIVSYGREITDFAGKPLKNILKFKGNLQGRLSVGMNMKFMMKSFGLDDYSMDALTVSGPSGIPDPVFGETGEDNTKMSMSCDLGLFYRPENYRMSFGVTLTDINNPWTALSEDSATVGDLCRLPAGLRLGAAYREPLMNIAFDLKAQGDDIDFHSGIERWFHGRDLALRAGYTHGSRSLNSIAVGACYRYNGRYRLDYVFLHPLSGLKELYGSHRISFTMSLGEMTEEREIRRQAENITKGINKAKREKREKMKKLDELKNKFLQKVNK